MILSFMDFISKEEFLEKHNKLSPANLQATMEMVERFQKEKRPLLKDNAWSLEKLRIHFISWMTSENSGKEAVPKKEEKRETGFKNYPETHLS